MVLLHNNMRLGFTLIELIIIAVIIGIVATFALPAFRVTQERAFDREVMASLMLIQAAQRIYLMENGRYFSTTGATPEEQIQDINNNLRLDLPTGANRKWDYDTAESIGALPPSFCSQATRLADSRTWCITQDMSQQPLQSGVCPGC